MAEMTRFSMQHLPADRRFGAWLERLGRSFGNVSGRSRGGPEFVAWGKKLSDRGITVSHMRVDPQSIELPQGGVSDQWRDSIHVVFPLIGQFHIAQCGQNVVISPGEGGLYDPSLGFKSAYESPVELLVLVAPRAALLGQAANFKDRLAQRFSCETG